MSAPTWFQPLVPSIPFFVAAVVQLLGALVRRVGNSFTEKYLEAAVATTVVPDYEKDSYLAGETPARKGKTAISDAYSKDAIKSVYAKNGDGSNAVLASLSLAITVLANGLIQVNIYGLLLAITFIVGFGIGIRLWTQDEDRYRLKMEARKLAISPTVLTFSVVNAVFGLVVLILSLIGLIKP
jgi:hypothetical protein